jgi:formylglycine-generating enzyme required for sulfatase activity
MATVYEARDHDLRRHVAMKVLASNVLSSSSSAPKVLARFLEEAQVTGQLHHPGVVPVHDIGIDREGRIFFTMQRVKGRDLKAIIELVKEEAGGWTLTRALGVILRICDTMAFAHAKGVVHRDLKPSNVMVGPYGEVYVMDWGLAKIRGRPDRQDDRARPDTSITISEIRSDRRAKSDESGDSSLATLEGSVLGTPSYMSPEQAGGRLEEVDPLSDVYSIGAILYHVLTGRVPYVDPGQRLSPRTILAMVLQGPPKSVHRLRPDLPAELCAICEKAMQPDRTRRYASVLDMRDDLQAYLDGRVVKAHRTGAIVEFRKWVQRNVGEAVAIAATIVVVIGASLVFALLQNRYARAVAGHAAVLADRNVALQAAKDQAEAQRNEAVSAWKAVDLERTRLQRRLDARLLDRHLPEMRRTLWPATPETLPQMDAWIAECDALLARRSVHARDLENLERAADPSLADEIAFLGSLLEFYDSFGEIDADVRRWRDRAANLVRVSIDDPRAEWEAAREAIRSSDLYRGLDLPVQRGLVPLGRNPETGLWEFWHVSSGTRPFGEPGRILLRGDSGIVLVLVPPGEFWLGSSAVGESLPNPDPHHLPDEGPPKRVSLDPFFVSKFEITQGQWKRVMGDNPSVYTSSITLDGRFTFDDTHPVENVTFEQCAEFCRRMELALPTEAQWEYACRAGTDTPFFCGATVASLQGFANIADRTHKQLVDERAGRLFTFSEEIEDGYPEHSPVGSFRPNPFGLHDALGNVWEYCRDEYGSYADTPPRPGDGLRLTAADAGGIVSPPNRVLRGGARGVPGPACRCAQRWPVPEDVARSGHGLRPVRALAE